MSGALRVVEKAIGTDEVGYRWRSDLDPGALPPTPAMSEGQRRVMRASLVHFASRGYGGSNVRDIAATLGIQAASVYKHFASKEEILAALVTLGYDYHRETIVATTLAADSTPQAQLTAFVQAHVRLHCDYPRLAKVTHHEWSHLPTTTLKLIERQGSQADAVLLGILERGTAAGVFTIIDPALAAVAISGLGMSAALWFPYQSEWSGEQTATSFTQTALNICRFPAATS